MKRARAASSDVYSSSGNSVATGTRIAADVIAIVELGPTSSCPHVPNTAYATPAASAAKRPASGGAPASAA